MAMNPSFFMICMAQSMDPLYLTASPDVIIMRRRIVSMGYEIRPDVIVTTEWIQARVQAWIQSMGYEIRPDVIVTTEHRQPAIQAWIQAGA